MKQISNFTVRLDAKTLKRLDALGKQFDVSRGEVLRRAIDEMQTPAERKQQADLLARIEANIFGMYAISNRRNGLMREFAVMLGTSGLAKDPSIWEKIGAYGTSDDVLVEKAFAGLPQLLTQYRENLK